MRRRIAIALLPSVLLVAAATAVAAEFSPGRCGFSVLVRGERIPYEIFAVYALPREELTLQLADAYPQALEARLGEEEFAPLAKGTVRRWRLPGENGLLALEIRRVGTSVAAMTINVFVEVPASSVRDGKLNGYRIDDYPKQVFRNLTVYRPPGGFIEVTPENRSTRISPHFRLEQFLCKQQSGYPKYVVLRERLLLKLEYLLQLVNDKGLHAETFAVLSGFRTPFYNRAIGNVLYSRHQWGGAADIFVDEEPRDGVMDDLNGDGRVDLEDAHYLYDLVESVSATTAFEGFVGGLGSYGTTRAHGPFVHVDARGYRARWGR